MANPLPNENQLYEQIKNECISIAPEIWDLLYYRIGNDITAINLVCKYYLNSQQPIPISEAEKILHHTHHIKDIVNKITVSSKEVLSFPEFIDDIPLHPVLREMFTHYIGNDVYTITLIVGDTIDPIDPKPISLELTQKVLKHIQSIREFMERLRIATSQEENTVKPKDTLKNNNRQLTKDQIFLRIRECLTQEFNLNEGKVQLNSRFKEDLGFDSIDTIRVIMSLEGEFGFEIADDEVDNVLTVSQAIEYISRRLTHPNKK